MLIPNNDILLYLSNATGKIIHLYGDPDAGRTSVMFSMIDFLVSLNRTCAYIVQSSQHVQAERFKRYIKDPTMCPIIIAKDRKALMSSLALLSSTIDTVFIDSFLSYILYRTKTQNLSLMSMLSGYAYGSHTNFVLCNDTRHTPGQDKTSPAYMEVFRRYSSKNVIVFKDEDTNILYNFKEW